MFAFFVPIRYAFILLIFLFGVDISIAQEKYVIQTDFVDVLTIDDQYKNEVYDVPAFIKTSGGFLIECFDIEKTFIVNNSKDRNIYFKLLAMNSNVSTEIVQLAPGDKISINSSIEEFGSSYLFSGFTNAYDKVVNFINETRYGLIVKGKAAYLQTSKAKVKFLQYNPSFLNNEDIFLSWETDERIKSVKILQDNKQLFKIKKNKSYEYFGYKNNAKKINSKLKAGEQYTVQITLKNKKKYQNNFYLLSPNDMEAASSFFKIL